MLRSVYTLVLGCLSLIPAYAQTSDTTPPVLVSFSFTPTSVDVSAGPQTVTVTARITDDLSGESYGYVYFYSPSDQYVLGYFARISGDALDGMYQASVTIPQFRQAGTWQAYVYMYDAAGNSSYLAPSTLQSDGFSSDLTVIDSVADAQPPTLVSVTFSPSTIDVSSSDVDVTISLHVTDNLTGANFSSLGYFALGLSPQTLSPALGSQQFVASEEFQLVSGTPQDGIWQAVKTIPRYSPNGVWQIQFVQLYDVATNFIYLGPTQLQDAGITPVLTVTSSPSDVTPPTLTGLSFSPSLINTSLGTQSVTISMSASDDLSGVDFTPTTPDIAYIQIGLSSPSGNQNVYVSPYTAPTNVAGTPLAGTWQMSVTWPQYSEEGTWKISFLSVKDRDANQVNYTSTMLEAMGLPDSVTVTKPSLTSDGTVGPNGGTVIDDAFGPRASVTFPDGVAPVTTTVSIDVFTSPLSVPTPAGFTVPGTYFMNISFSPSLGTPLRSPGITVVLPLLTPMTPGAHLSLYHIDPVTGTLAPAMNAFGHFVVGTVNGDGLSAAFLNVVTLSTVVAYLSNGSILGDVNGDGSVTCADVSLMKASFGKHTGQAGFNSAADLNNDGVVDIKDLFIVTRQLPAGMKCQ